MTEIRERLARVDSGDLASSDTLAVFGDLNPGLAGIVVAAALLAIGMSANARTWVALRVLVTVVHELGHAVVGVLCGRRLTGITVAADMSGQTVTVGKPRGVGRVLTTIAGYPVPPVVGAAFMVAAAGGFAPVTLAVSSALLVVLLVMVRSALTFAVFVLAAALGLATWWWGGPVATTGLLMAFGIFLVIGGLRAVLSLIAEHSRGRTSRSDAATLADLTPLPAGLWLAVFLVVSLAAAVAGAMSVWDVFSTLA